MQDRLDVLHAGDDRHDDRKDAVAHAEGDLGGGTDAEIEDEQRQDGDLRRAVEQQDDRHEALCANGCSPTASPTTSPIATDIAKATASSQNVIRSAAGTPRVSNTRLQRHQDPRRRAEEHRIDPPARGDLPEDEQRQHARRARASPGRRSQQARDVLAAGVIVCRLRPRFERGHDGVEDHRDRDHEGDVGEHARASPCASARCTMRWPRPASDAMVSLPMIDSSATVKPMRSR